MSLFICFKSFLVLSVRKNILSRIKLALKTIQSGCLENREIDMYPKLRTTTGIATGTGTGKEKDIEVGLRVARNKKK